jgi:hypothetical protein
MNKGYRPLIIEDIDGNKVFVNCCLIVSITKNECFAQNDQYVVEISEALAKLRISRSVAEILMDRLVDELFFTAESIEKEKAILSQPEEQDEV